MELNKKVKILGKQIPAVLIALVAIAGLASAGLLSYYGKVVGTATVSQSVQVSLNGQDWKQCTEAGACDLTFTVNPVAGDPITQTVYVENTANAQANVKLDTTCPTDFPTKDETTPGEVNCYEDAGKTKLGVTIDYAVKDKGGTTVSPTNGVYSLSKASSPYTLDITYTFAINTEPKSYDIVTQIVPA